MNYPGGKNGIYQKLINLMPPHEVFIEPYLGSGAVMRHKRQAKINIGIDIDPKAINLWPHESQTGVHCILGDAIDYLKNYKFTGEELIYLDPPYLRETRKRRRKLYIYEYTTKQHRELLELIKTLPCMVMISGYESKLYTQYLENWHTYSFQACTHNGVATEWVWMNYPTPAKLHDYSYLGDNFKKREHVKKKTKRWVTKLKSMPVLERHAIMTALSTACKEQLEQS